jgi:bifunctional non-homologous end joining protein LigD
MSTMGRVKLRSRRGIELAPTFPRLVDENREADPRTDGPRRRDRRFDANGKPSFNALQNRWQMKGER